MSCIVFHVSVNFWHLELSFAPPSDVIKRSIPWSRRVGACGLLSKLSNINYVGYREGHVDYIVVRIRLCGLCDWLLGFGLLLVFREIINRTDLCFANRVLKVSIWWKWKYTIRWLFTYEFEQHSSKGSFKINAQDTSAHFCQKLKLKLHLGHDLKIEIPAYQYRKSHCGYKTNLRPS